MANALVTRNDTLPMKSDWDVQMQMGEVLFRSGILPAHIKNAAATVAIIQKGKELGIPPMHALSNIAVIQGKPTANSELMLALIYRDHGDDAVRVIQSNELHCVVAYKRRNWKEAQQHMFTIDEAKKANLMKNETWTKYPAAMLRARYISAVARMAFPDSIGGMYTAEELGAEVDQDGQVIVAHVEPEPTPIRAVAAPEPDAKITDTQMKHMWALAQDYYGSKEANRKLHEWIADEFPDAKISGKPSVRALTAAQAEYANDMLAKSIAALGKYSGAIEAAASDEEPEADTAQG